MKPRTDVTALVAGLLACALAVLGLWGAFGVIAWSLVAVITPLILVIVGVIGLFASRERS